MRHEDIVIELERILAGMNEAQKAAYNRLRLEEIERGDAGALVLLCMGFIGIPNLHRIKFGDAKAYSALIPLFLSFCGIASCAQGTNAGLIAGAMLVVLSGGASMAMTAINIIRFDEYLSAQRNRRLLALVKRVASNEQQWRQ